MIALDLFCWLFWGGHRYLWHHGYKQCTRCGKRVAR